MRMLTSPLPPTKSATCKTTTNMIPDNIDRRIIILCILMSWLQNGSRRSAFRSRRRNIIRRQAIEQREMRNRQFEEMLSLSLTLSGVLLSAVLPSRTVDRSVWTFNRSGDWWENIVPSFQRKQWMENFRMSKETFLVLVGQLRGRIERHDTQLRRAIDVERRVASVIWKLATNCEYRTVGHLFGISSSSICNMMRDVCMATVQIMQPRLIKIPTGDTLRNIIDEFEARWNFPQVAGAIDGSHIPIVRPHEYHTDYFNHKQFYSVILQGVVDYRYCFWDINVGWPGSVHDARVLANSDLYQKGEEGTLFPSWNKEINGVNVPILLLGDPAYPLLPWIMKPYLDSGNLTRDQKSFAYKLSRTRMVVENAFGRLKGRWRILLKRLDCQIDFVPYIISACCTLHNFCEMSGEGINDDWLEDIQDVQEEINEAYENQEVGQGVEVRNALKDYLCQ